VPSPPAQGGSLLRRAAGPLVISALAILFLCRALFTGDVLLPAGYLSHFQPWTAVMAPSADHWNALLWDSIAQYYPWRAFAHDAITRGVIPLWNPYQFCGTPFVANSQSAVFYPPNILFYVLDPARAFAVSAVLHLFLGGLFMYMFLRMIDVRRFGATFGGLTFAFCGFFAAWIHLPTVMNTAVWLPLGLYFIARYFTTHHPGNVVGLGFAVGTAALAGHPQILLYVAGTSGVYFIFRAATASGGAVRRVGRGVIIAAGALTIATLWGAVQLLPTAELLPLSHRATTASAGGYTAYLRFAMPWQQLVTLLLPEFMGNPVYGTYWGRGNFAEYAAYIGLVPLALAALGVVWRRDKEAFFFAALAVLALLAALGTPVNLALFYLVPGFSSTGGPSRMLFIFSAAVAILAGMGADAAAGALMEPLAARRFARHFVAAGVIVGAITLAFTGFLAAIYPVPFPALLSAPAINLAVMCVVVPVGLAAYWIAARLARPGAFQAALAVLVAVSVGDLFAFGMRCYLTAPREDVYPATEITSYLRGHARAGRIMPLYRSWGFAEFPSAVLPPNAATVYGLHDVEGYDSLYLARYRSVIAAVEGQDPSPAANGNMLLGSPPDPALLGALGVEYVLSEAPLDLPGLPRERVGEVNVYRVQNFLPRAYCAASVVTVPDLRGALEQLDRAARHEVVLETTQPAQHLGATTTPARMASIERDGPNLLRLKTGPGYVVVTDAHYPGWRAWVDRSPAEILIANGAFRAVWVGRGQHDVVMRFEPTSFRLGLFGALIAVVVGMAAAGAGLMRRRSRG
jgi:hypothetical protein